MFCCDEFEKLLELGYIFKADSKAYLMYSVKAGNKRVLSIRYCLFCGEGEISPRDEELFLEMTDCFMCKGSGEMPVPDTSSDIKVTED
jgi:hypothetical protein